MLENSWNMKIAGIWEEKRAHELHYLKLLLSKEGCHTDPKIHQMQSFETDMFKVYSGIAHS